MSEQLQFSEIKPNFWNISKFIVTHTSTMTWLLFHLVEDFAYSRCLINAQSEEWSEMLDRENASFALSYTNCYGRTKGLPPNPWEGQVHPLLAA
jgi:hypothetical protein